MKTDFKEKELFIKYGLAATEAMFDFPCEFFRLENCEGVIAYRIKSNCAIVFGGPICPPHEKDQLIKAFHAFCDKSGLNALYVIVNQELKNYLENKNCQKSMEVCEELIFDPFFDFLKISHRLKHRVEKAAKAGLIVEEYKPYNADLEMILKKLGKDWQQAIKGANVYLGHLDFFDSYEGRRWFYIKDEKQITAMMMLSKIESSNGFLLKFLVASPHARHDTTEFLVTSVFDILKKEDCHFVTKGMVPGDILKEIKGFSKITTFLLRNIYLLIAKIFKFKKRKEYWFRYHPKIEPAFLVFRNHHFGLNEVKALLDIFKTNYTSDK